MNELPPGVADLGEDAGDEVHCLEDLGALVVVAGLGRYVAVGKPGEKRVGSG